MTVGKACYWWPNEITTAIHPGVKIGHVHLKVADLDRALAFYRMCSGLR